MQSDKIIILDSDESNTSFFADRLRPNDVEIDIFRNLSDMGHKVSVMDFKMVLINYSTILEAERMEVVGIFKQLRGHDLIVYNVPDRANRRLAFYDLGASRVYDESVSPDEICYRMKWLLTSLATASTLSDRYSEGKLEDIPLATLIKIFGKENRTGVMKIVTRYNSGKIYLYNGDIDDAQVGYHKADKAVLHMLFWKNGSFSFSPVEQAEPSAEIKISNIGMLLLAEGLRRDFLVHLEEIGPPSSVLRIKNSGDLLASDSELHTEFVRFLEKPRMLEEIIENPYYTCYETAEMLVGLRRRGFLVVSEPTKLSGVLPQEKEEKKLEPAETIELSLSEVETVKENLNLEDQKGGKLLIMGSPDSGKTEFVGALSNSKRAVRSEHGLDLGHLLLDRDIDLFLLGVTISEKAIETIHKLSEGVSGYVFLVDSEREDLLEYTNYLVNYLASRNDIPWTIAMTRSSDPQTLKGIQKSFTFSVPVEWQICDCTDTASIRDTLLSLRKHEIPEEVKAEEVSEEAAETGEGEKAEDGGEGEEPQAEDTVL